MKRKPTNAVSTAIASAVEEQGAATQQITQNMQDAARGTREVTANIVGVSKGIANPSQASAMVLASADGLRRQADDLRDEVDRFLDTIREA